ncbi:hypothetical protein AB0L88_24745 [Saccharopolyspora shandongensis]|uniref:hypothetical protein n=1 Tax=Saccharopolyspora shandongensis TaxID=418495 RepID=UPI003439FD70
MLAVIAPDLDHLAERSDVDQLPTTAEADADPDRPLGRCSAVAQRAHHRVVVAAHHLDRPLQPVDLPIGGSRETLRERQLEDHERGDDRLEEAGPTPASTPEEQRSDRLATGARAVLLVELVLALAGGALHHLQIQGDIEFRSLTATTLLVAGSGAIVFGLLCLGLLRRFAGTDISSYLGWPALGAGAITAMFIGAAFAGSQPDRGDSTFLRRNLTCAILVSAVPAVWFALDLSDTSKTETAWTALAVLVVIVPPAIHAIRRRAQLERVRKAGLRPRL